MLLKRKVDIETAKADIEGVNSLHKTAQNKSADRYSTKSDSKFLGVFGEKTVNVLKVNLMLDGIL